MAFLSELCQDLKVQEEEAGAQEDTLIEENLEVEALMIVEAVEGVLKIEEVQEILIEDLDDQVEDLR